MNDIEFPVLGWLEPYSNYWLKRSLATRYLWSEEKLIHLSPTQILTHLSGNSPYARMNCKCF